MVQDRLPWHLFKQVPESTISATATKPSHSFTIIHIEERRLNWYLAVSHLDKIIPRHSKRKRQIPCIPSRKHQKERFRHVHVVRASKFHLANEKPVSSARITRHCQLEPRCQRRYLQSQVSWIGICRPNVRISG